MDPWGLPGDKLEGHAAVSESAIVDIRLLGVAALLLKLLRQADDNDGVSVCGTSSMSVNRI